jgi:periplasmic divalent cation tolerance protein
MTDKILVLSTAGSERDAGNIAYALLERQLAACVNILPKVASVYRWQGKIERAEEWLLVIKTTKAAFENVRDTIRELHSYEVPECISFSIENGSADYLQWIEDSVQMKI